MKGLELAERYYTEIGLPMIERQFGDWLPRMAIGLVGEGSECLGFDDEISQDHDFGPAFCIWLEKTDFKAIGYELHQAYLELPKEFEGFSPRLEEQKPDRRVGVFEIKSFYRNFIGDEQPPTSMINWLYLDEAKLAAVTSGKVFVDNLGDFSCIRETLLKYYPEPVRVKKIAARAARMAQSGQYNYGRCMRRGEVVAARLALDEFIRNAISMLYLLNKKYMPFYKWMYRGMQDFTVLREVSPLIAELAICNDTSTAWSEPHGENWNPYVNMDDKRVVLIEKISSMVIAELKRQSLTAIDDDFLEPHAWQVMQRVGDERLSRCHVMEG